MNTLTKFKYTFPHAKLGLRTSSFFGVTPPLRYTSRCGQALTTRFPVKNGKSSDNGSILHANPDSFIKSCKNQYLSFYIFQTKLKFIV